MMEVISPGPVPEWAWHSVFLPESLPLAVRSVSPTKGELIPELCALLQDWVCWEEGGISPHSRKHLLLSQPRSLDQILSTCPILGGASIQASGGGGGGGAGRQGLALPTISVAFIPLCGLKSSWFLLCLRVWKYHAYYGKYHTCKGFDIWPPLGRECILRELSRRRPFSTDRNKQGWRVISHPEEGFLGGRKDQICLFCICKKPLDCL